MKDFFMEGEWIGSIEKYVFVMKVSPDTVTIPGRKAWKNRHLASGIVTRL
jgi:hypothetical protein